jgi:hypothetical protein
MAEGHDTSPRQQRCATRIEKKTNGKEKKMKEQTQEQIQRVVLVMKKNERERMLYSD